MSWVIKVLEIWEGEFVQKRATDWLYLSLSEEKHYFCGNLEYEDQWFYFFVKCLLINNRKRY